MQPISSTNQDQLSRKRGMFLGLAIGDALGAAVEFKSPGTFEPVTSYRSGGPHKLKAGQWTDDTSMALALADSIIESGWNINDQATRYLHWYRSGRYSVTGTCFDIGITTSQALRRFEQTANALNSGDSHDNASGNGSIMRLAPVPIAYSKLFPQDISKLADLAIQSSLPTHSSHMCQSACAVLGVMLAALVHGLPREVILDPAWPSWQHVTKFHDIHPRILEIIAGSYRIKQPPQIKGSGFVVESLEAALWAFANSASFEECVLKAVNLGHDSDTTGAVAGQLAGACWGESQIPESLLTGLDGRDILDPTLNRLVDCVPNS